MNHVTYCNNPTEWCLRLGSLEVESTDSWFIKEVALGQTVWVGGSRRTGTGTSRTCDLEQSHPVGSSGASITPQSLSHLKTNELVFHTHSVIGRRLPLGGRGRATVKAQILAGLCMHG